MGRERSGGDRTRLTGRLARSPPLRQTAPVSESDTPLPALREHLSDLDRQIVELIAERFRVVADVGREKAGSDASIRDPERERQVLAAVAQVARSTGAPVDLVLRMYRDLLGESVSRQVSSTAGQVVTGRARVAVRGAQHTSGFLAVQKYLSGTERDGELVASRSYHAAVESLKSGDVDLAVLPIENTIAGSINEVYDLLRENDVSIVGEETWSVDHCLAGISDVPLGAIRQVLSELDGLEQCSAFVEALPRATRVLHPDAGEAMRAVAAAADPTQVAIGTPEAAAAHGLTVLRRGIANHAENYTRFVVLARHAVAVPLNAPCKTSLIFVSRHEQGALMRSLDVLGNSGHSMTKLESRPRPGRPWEYMFFLDFEGNIADPRTAGALDDLRSTSLHLKVLGSYPAKATKVEFQPGDSTPLVSDPSGVDLLEAVVTSASAPRASSNYRLAGRAARTADTVVPVGGLLVGGSGFVVMAGPCSVESAEQVTATARAVREAGAQILRGGVFKPRTSPYAFQGLGWEGLELLAAAGRATGMPIISEVMAVDQVRRMAEIVDVLQVGARNMQNFDLLRELGRVDRPILLKRGLSSTIEEWLGAAEYILAIGNQQVMLCERGIRTFETSTRNTLDLSAIPVLRERTHLPVIVDPSHGTGYRAYVAPMARAARAAGAHGLLIEVHPHPETALSDAAQSLSFGEFLALMRSLETVGSLT
jgi:3-deoxy-7-phosphoheptulonate synthase